MTKTLTRSGRRTAGETPEREDGERSEPACREREARARGAVELLQDQSRLTALVAGETPAVPVKNLDDLLTRISKQESRLAIVNDLTSSFPQPPFST